MGPRPVKISKVPHFVQNVGLLNAQAKVAQKIVNGKGAQVTVVPSYCTPLYSTVMVVTVEHQESCIHVNFLI